MKKLFVNFEALRGATVGRQETDAEKIGITQVSLSYKLRGKRKITFPDLNKIAEALGRDATDFIVIAEKKPEYLEEYKERAAA